MARPVALAQALAVALAALAVAAASGVPPAAAGRSVVGPVSPRGGLLRVAPEIPIVGSRVTVQVRLPGAEVPAAARLDLVAPSGQKLRRTLRRVAPGLLSGSFQFADDGLWKLRVTGGGIDARADLLVLQNGAVAPAPKGGVVVAPAGDGGLGLLGGR